MSLRHRFRCWKAARRLLRVGHPPGRVAVMARIVVALDIPVEILGAPGNHWSVSLDADSE